MKGDQNGQFLKKASEHDRRPNLKEASELNRRPNLTESEPNRRPNSPNLTDVRTEQTSERPNRPNRPNRTVCRLLVDGSPLFEFFVALSSRYFYCLVLLFASRTC